MTVITNVDEATEFLEGLTIKSYDYPGLKKVIDLLRKQEDCINGYKYGYV